MWVQRPHFALCIALAIVSSNSKTEAVPKSSEGEPSSAIFCMWKPMRRSWSVGSGEDEDELESEERVVSNAERNADPQFPRDA